MVDFLLSRYAPSEGEEGQGLAEYALILALIAIVAIPPLCSSGGRSRGPLAIGNAI